MGASPIYATGTGDPYAGQPPWGTTPSDSLQYELFFGDRFVSIRALKFPSCTFTYAWLFDRQSARPLFTSYEPLHDPAGKTLNAENANLVYGFAENGGSIGLDTPDTGSHTFEIAETHSTLWRFPPDDIVIHQPSLKVTWTHGAETLNGVGYCKRYTCGAENEHMYWRFITGPIAGDLEWFWTAEAAFNLRKYDYFKVINTAGEIGTADQPGTWHRDRMARGVIAGTEHTVTLEDLGRLEFEIRQGPSNTKMSQAFCKATFTGGGPALETYALNEIACGIHG